MVFTFDWLLTRVKRHLCLHRQLCCHTCAMRIPVTMASWCSVPSAPRRLVGAISPMYIGVRPDANPARRQSQIRQRNFEQACKGGHGGGAEGSPQ